MQFTYPKHEKLKSKTTIDLLFSDGNSVSKFPLRLVYVENTEENAELIKMGVSVSKKYFKKAVDRNYYKHLLIDNLKKPYKFMFFYQTKERLYYQEIEEKTIQLFQKFIETTK